MRLLVYGLVTGILFGFLLQKGRVLRYDRQVGALRFLDMTIVKFMFSAILVAMVGIYLLRDLGLVELRMKGPALGANIIGGLVFGVGWGLLGYCPGTAMGAFGEGRWDALFGLLGMVAGAAVYAEAFPFFRGNVLTWGTLGDYTIDRLIGVNHWVVIALFVVMGLLFFRWFEKKGL